MNVSIPDGFVVGPPSQAKQAETPRSDKPRVVTFAPVCDVILVSEEEAASRSYSRNDIRRFHQTMLRDIVQLRRDFGSIEDDHRLYDCVGLDGYISPSLFRRSNEAKRAHVAAILDEQERSRARGEDDTPEEKRFDAERLCQKARESSRWARGRAERSAAAFLQLGKYD